MRYLVNGELTDLEAVEGVQVTNDRGKLRVQTQNGQSSALAVRKGNKVEISYMGQVFVCEKPSAVPSKSMSKRAGESKSPMPGQIVEVFVEQGEWVKAGQKLLVLEAMKMQHSISAPFDGQVTDLFVAQGDQVQEGQILIHVDQGHEDSSKSV